MRARLLKKKDRQDYVMWFVMLIFAIILLVLSKLDVIDPNISAAIIAALVSIVTLSLSHQRRRQQEIEQEHRKRKEPIYEEFVSRLINFFLSFRPGVTRASQVSLADYLIDFTQKVIVWGSDEFVKEYVSFRRELRDLPQDPASGLEEKFRVIEDLILAIRADLGHNNEGFERGDLLTLFISDIEKHLEETD